MTAKISEIREATLAEADAIAGFHVRIWRETYRDMAPEEAVRLLDETRRLPSWIETLGAEDPRRGTLVALSGGAIVGLVSFGPPGAAIYGSRGEVKHLYVDGSQRGRGLGRTLLGRAFQRMSEQDFEGLGLSVVEGNAAARRFYKSVGGTEQDRFQDPGPLWKSNNILVVWPKGFQLS